MLQRPSWEGVPAKWVYLPGGVPARGVYLPGGWLGDVPAQGVYLPGGCTYQGVYLPGGGGGWGCLSQPEADTPLWTESQTPVKT